MVFSISPRHQRQPLPSMSAIKAFLKHRDDVLLNKMAIIPFQNLQKPLIQKLIKYLRSETLDCLENVSSYRLQTLLIMYSIRRTFLPMFSLSRHKFEILLKFKKNEIDCIISITGILKFEFGLYKYQFISFVKHFAKLGFL